MIEIIINEMLSVACYFHSENFSNGIVQFWLFLAVNLVSIRKRVLTMDEIVSVNCLPSVKCQFEFNFKC